MACRCAICRGMEQLSSELLPYPSSKLGPNEKLQKFQKGIGIEALLTSIILGKGLNVSYKPLGSEVVDIRTKYGRAAPRSRLSEAKLREQNSGRRSNL